MINTNPNYNNSKVIDKMPLNTTPLATIADFLGLVKDGSFNIRVIEGAKYNNIINNSKKKSIPYYLYFYLFTMQGGQ